MSLVCDAGWLSLAFVLVAGCLGAESPARQLRLVPFPKSVSLEKGTFRLYGRLSVTVGKDPADRFAAEDLSEEIRQRTGIEPEICEKVALSSESDRTLYLTMNGATVESLDAAAVDEEKGEEAYALRVFPKGVVVRSRGSRGLFYGVQTLKHLIRANMREGGIPSVTIRDWPSLRYRGFQDDITRGPNPLLETLKREIRLGAEVKYNFFTYYLEHQFAFGKHPDIGPAGGSLTPDELKELVNYAEKYHVEIIGNQQSFGHFEHILKHERYAHLRETPNLLCPTEEESYRLLDDLYSEQIPLLKSRFFNVCCDETWGLGTGPSKGLAEKIGVGGVYAKHMRRVHDLLKMKYGKRMMMWGDIILQHPEDLKNIPKDTVMLTWGYDARESFQNQIVPFARSGYEFFVCPGVSCWNRILPDFGVAVENIRNFVRGGAKHGALGMLNTTWDDDGENLFHYNWHGVFWGAECPWNASGTEAENFDRRFGAVFLGEKEEHLGRAIEAVSRTHRLRGYDGMGNHRFWEVKLEELRSDPGVARSQAGDLLKTVDPAIEELLAARRDAKLNADVLDYLLFGAERMKLMATRTVDFLDAAEKYRRAHGLGAASAEAKKLLSDSVAGIRGIRDAHVKLKKKYSELWLRESKPYALDAVQERFDTVIAVYDSLLGKLRSAEEALAAGKEIPPPPDVGL